MSEVIPFQSAEELASGRTKATFREIARNLIAELGDRAGYEVSLVARLPELPSEARQRLLAIAQEIEGQQGFGWYFADAEESMPDTAPPGA